MGVTPYSDTQQKIAIHVANITHHGSMAQICNEFHCGLSLFLPASTCIDRLRFWFTYWWWQYGFNL